MWQIYDTEENESCRAMIADNIAEIEYLADREALTRRFFIALQYEPRMKLRGNTIEGIIPQENIAVFRLEHVQPAKVKITPCGVRLLIQPLYF